MKKINAKFIAGMLAMALVFGMAFASCEQETVTKEVPVPGGGGGTITKEVPITAMLAGGPEAVKAFLKGELGGNVDTLYITSQITLDGSSGYALGSGKTIVVTNGTLPTNLNTLALPNAGALFTISAPDGPAELKVKGTLNLANGSKVVLGSATAPEESGKLTIEGDGKVIVTKGASVTTTTSSQIQLVTATSTLVFEDTTAKLNVVGTLETDETVVGETAGSALIVVQSGGHDLTIGAGNVTINGSAANGDQLGKEGGFTGSTKTVSGGDLGSLTLTKDETLIVSGNVTASAKLDVPEGGTLEIAEGATLSVEKELSLGKDASLTVAEGAKITVAEAGELTVGENAELKVENGAEIAVAGDLTVGAADEDGGKLTIAEGATVSVSGTLTLAQSVDDAETDPTASDRGVLNGTLVIESDGVFKDLSYGQGALWGDGPNEGTGSITIKAGGKAYTYTGVQMVSGDATASSPSVASDYVLIQLTEGEFTLKKAEYILNGTATLQGKFGISEDMTLSLKAGSTLNIDTKWGTGTNSLDIWSGAKIQGEIVGGSAAPKIVVATSDTIAINSGGTNNFYPSGSTDAIATPIPAGTYNWDATLGSNAGGWKAEAAAEPEE
jgi:hypothetical protein